MKSKVFFLILILLSSIPKGVKASEYGEESESLGQFVDNFENTDKISVMDRLINNQTLDIILLNYTQNTVVSNDTIQLKEQRRSNSYTVYVTFDITDDEYIRTRSSIASFGLSWIWIMVDKDYMDGKYIRYRYKGSSSIAGKYIFINYYFNGTIDRKTGFDEPGTMPTGKTIVGKYLTPIGVYNEWVIMDNGPLDTSNVSDGLFSFTWRMSDSYAAQSWDGYIDWIEINSGPSGEGNLWRVDFNGTQDVVMEQTGTYYDYGYVDDPDLPIYGGGYENEGYLITEDYLNYSKGKSLVFQTISTIPEGTSIEAQFSPDNETWVNHLGTVGSTEIESGLFSIDLRNLNYADIFSMINFKGTSSLTPFLNQTRLITTEGNGLITKESDEPWIAIAIILMVIAFLLVGVRQ